MALTLDDTQTADLLKTLGLPPDTTDVATIIATITDLADDEASELDVAPSRPSAIAAAAKRHGMDIVDTATHEALKRDAAAGRQIAAAAAKAKVEASVDDAVGKGKITPSRSKHWVSLIEADPGMAEVLAAVPNETAVPLSEVGHSADVNTGDLADAAEWFY
jgi:hypothetical protein